MGRPNTEHDLVFTRTVRTEEFISLCVPTLMEKVKGNVVYTCFFLFHCVTSTNKEIIIGIIFLYIIYCIKNKSKIQVVFDYYIQIKCRKL